VSPRSTLPLVYSCSGCSDLAQIANRVAISLDREGLVQMSCIAGVGGDVKPLVKLATSGRPILALDGCPLHCVRSCLARHGVTPTQHFTLTELGLRKRMRQDFDPQDAQQVLEHVRPAVSSLAH
jgi:uncharacterized metal-binding protein